MDAFLAFLEHVHSVLTTTYHNTPILLMASPQWTRRDNEAIARYIFEKTKTPALCLIHSGVATQYGLKWPHMTVVDVGYEKVDVTCIYEGRVVAHKDIGAKPDDEEDEDGNANELEGGEGISGGEVFTRRLMELLRDQEFDHEMAEQLKKSNVCEVLPYVPDAPELMELPNAESGAAVTAAAATVPVVATSSGEGPKIITTAAAPAEDIDALNGEEKVVDEEGVLDVANIVASGNTREFLAKQEKLKAEKAKGGPGRKGKGQEPDANAAKAVRLPNSKRVKAIFHYEESITEDVPVAQLAAAAAAPPKENGAPAPAKDVEMTDADAPAPAEGEEATKDGEEKGTKKDGDEPKIGEEAKTEEQPKVPEAAPETAVPAVTEPTAPAEPVATERVTRRIRRDIEVGLERFKFADRREIDRIVTTIYRAVQGIDDMYMRPSCWENVVFVGNGARIRGLRDNIMQTLQARHLISPSSATMFTSELPSNIGTPSGTGSQTPTSSFTGGPPHQLPATSSGVNPLLQAATTAASLGVPGQQSLPPSMMADQQGGGGQPSHHFHTDAHTPISTKPKQKKKPNHPSY